MRPRTPKALNLSLNLVGAFSLALAASSAEASTMGAEDEFCNTCDKDDPQARANYDHDPKPTDVAATRPTKPEAKTTPEFTPEGALPSVDETESVPPEDIAQPSRQQTEVASSDMAAAPAPAAPTQTVRTFPAAANETAAADTEAADVQTENLAAAPAPTPAPQPAQANSAPAELAAAPAPTPVPQPVQIPAAESPPAVVTTPEPTVPFAVVPSTAGDENAIAGNENTGESQEMTAEVPPPPNSLPTQGGPDLPPESEPFAVSVAPAARPEKPVSVSLPAFVETRREANSPGRVATASARPSATPSATTSARPASLSRSRSGRGLSKRSINLPHFQPEPELVAIDVLSVWNRFVPFPEIPAAQDWAQDLPTEAVPTTTVQAPEARVRQARLSRSVPVARARTQPIRPPSPQLPSFDLPQPQARATASTMTEPLPRQSPLRAQMDASDEAQADSPNTATAEIQREDLRIEPLATDPVPTVRYSPSPNAGIPSAFGAAWGDVFASATVTGADRLRNEVDGSISAGFGVGNPATAVGVELAYNLLSLRNFAENGSFDAKIHREVFTNDTTQAAVAVGWNNFVNYGDDVAGTESSVYGVVSAAHLLQPEHPTHRLPITGTLGVGGGNFSGDNSDVGVIAGVGLQVDPRLSLNAAWSGVGLNVTASVAPLPEIPLTLNFLYGDITNNTEAGSVAAFTVGYGFNFGPRF